MTVLGLDNLRVFDFCCTPGEISFQAQGHLVTIDISFVEDSSIIEWFFNAMALTTCFVCTESICFNSHFIKEWWCNILRDFFSVSLICWQGMVISMVKLPMQYKLLDLQWQTVGR